MIMASHHTFSAKFDIRYTSMGKSMHFKDIVRTVFNPYRKHSQYYVVVTVGCVSDLHDPNTHLNETAISLFQPFRPMLGQRAGIDQVSNCAYSTYQPLTT